MKLRYYLRGLGIGILVTAVILSIVFRNRETMSDAQVVERAKELGMEEKYQTGTLAEMSQEQTDDAAATQNEKADDAAAKPADTTAAADESGKAAEDAATADTTTDETEKTTDDAAVKTEDEKPADEKPETETPFIVNSGEGSDTIAAHLAKAGIVKDGAAFDAFLCSKGYDRKLRAGKHTIPANATEEQIAQALMQMPEE